MFWDYMLVISKYVIILLSIAIIVRCLRSMLSERYESETWAYIRCGRELFPVQHWEATLGRAESADVRIFRDGVSRIHAIIKRNDAGRWTVHDVFGKGRIWVNGNPVEKNGTVLQDRDIINLNGVCVRFHNITTEKHRKLEEKRTVAGGKVSPAMTLIELTVLQAFLLVQFTLSATPEDFSQIALAFAILCMLQWLCYNAMRIMDRSGFEPEILAFYLTTIGLAVAAGSVPQDLLKQALLVLVSVVLFLLWGIWLRKVGRTSATRLAAAVAALGLLCVNVLAGTSMFGAINWLEIGGIVFQPSELVKVAYVYFGAATMDILYKKRNLYSFIVFSAICVIALALMGDFGTALIFFVSFLVISFMRSGSIATVFLAVSGAAIAGSLAISARPYIAQRFASWGHIWEDVYGAGYQQTRALSAAASGGLLGKGAGAGWFKNMFAANTDMVFAVICEELGLIVAMCAIIALLTLSLFAFRAVRHGRTAYHGIAACAAMTMMVIQMSLNVFGTVDILPFTGVTFPFVSRGGTSLISCWMMLAYIKGADTRRSASFAVRPISDIEIPPDPELDETEAQE